MSSASANEFHNQILRAQSPDAVTALRPHLACISLVPRQVLYERGNRITDVFFVESGIVSQTSITMDNDQVEVSIVGRDGLVGVSTILNPNAFAIHHTFTLVPGSAYRINADAFRACVEQFPGLRSRCLRYADFLIAQTSQIAGCNARHTLVERLARWLLMMRDLLDSDDLPLTQEFLSFMLGVRRAGVSVAASALQAGGLIRCGRGRVTVTDHEGLTAAACDCYRIIQASRDAILGRPDQ